MNREILEDGTTLYIGIAREIFSLYRNLEKRDIAYVPFNEEPMFNMDKVYGIYINYMDTTFNYPTIEILNETTILSVVYNLYK